MRGLQTFFNAILFEERSPEACRRRVVVLFFRKGVKTKPLSVAATSAMLKNLLVLTNDRHQVYKHRN